MNICAPSRGSSARRGSALSTNDSYPGRTKVVDQRLYIYVCVCVYIHIYIYMYVYIIYLYIYISIYLYVYVNE